MIAEQVWQQKFNFLSTKVRTGNKTCKILITYLHAVRHSIPATVVKVERSCTPE